jgi:2-polyprenyl-3-methyl-5-hydroxy-6-metoxy-1,4-benzoquinol methylase
MVDDPGKYASSRQEMVEFVPASARRLLDVGCAVGGFGAELRSARPDLRIWGIDVTPHPESIPQPYEERMVGAFPDAVPAGMSFDCIVFNDVLEHLVDPWSALRTVHRMLDDGGSVVASIPNFRHLTVVKPLLLRGRLDYRETGILDRTHLRFFTRSTMIELFEVTGFSVERVAPLRVSTAGTTATLNRWARGRFEELLAEQYAIVARPS